MPMTPEERERYDRIDRQLEFVANNVASHDAQITENSKQIGQLVDVMLSLTRVVEEQGRSTDERFRELAESQRHTGERLSALINVVERYFSNGRH